MEIVNSQLFYNIRDALLCLGFLIGFVGGIVLLVRKKTGAGILAILGFFLFSLDPLIELVLFRLLYNNFGDNLQAMDMVYTCVSGPAILLGSICLLAALLLAARPSQPKSLEGTD